MQGHDKNECRILNSNIGEVNVLVTEEKAKDKQQPQSWVNRPQKGKAKILSCGRVVGDPGLWNVVKDRRSKAVVSQTHTMVENSFAVLTEEPHSSSSNPFQVADNKINNNNTTLVATDEQILKNNKLHNSTAAKMQQQQGDSCRKWVTQVFGNPHNDVQEVVASPDSKKPQLDSSGSQGRDALNWNATGGVQDLGNCFRPDKREYNAKRTAAGNKKCLDIVLLMLYVVDWVILGLVLYAHLFFLVWS